VVVILSLIVMLKWHAWFYLMPEQAYSVPCTPDRVTLTYGENSLSTRSLTWRCDTTLHKSSLQIVRDDRCDTMLFPVKGKIVSSRSGKQAFYHVRMVGLKLNHKYSYRVQSGDKKSKWYSFDIIDSRKKLDFLLFGDVQDEPGGDSKKIFEQAQARYPQAQFWAFVGDAVEGPNDMYWNVFMSSIDGIEGTKPLMMCTGNHEYLKGVIKKIDSRWVNTFMYPANGDERHLGRNYYVDFPLLRYIVLDTDGLQTFSDYSLTLAWLKKVLSANSRRWTVVMMHHPVYSSSQHRQNLLIRWLFKPVFEKYKVDMVIAGHDHSYMRRNSGNTTPVYFICTSSSKYYLTNCDIAASKICCGHRMYYYVTANDNTLQMQCYLVENNRLYDDVVINKNGRKVTVMSHCDKQPELIDLPKNLKRSSSKFLKMRKKRLEFKQRNQ
jgi:predicted phosphohydrolase